MFLLFSYIVTPGYFLDPYVVLTSNKLVFPDENQWRYGQTWNSSGSDFITMGVSKEKNKSLPPPSPTPAFFISETKQIKTQDVNVWMTRKTLRFVCLAINFSTMHLGPSFIAGQKRKAQSKHSGLTQWKILQFLWKTLLLHWFELCRSSAQSHPFVLQFSLEMSSIETGWLQAYKTIYITRRKRKRVVRFFTFSASLLLKLSHWYITSDSHFLSERAF